MYPKICQCLAICTGNYHNPMDLTGVPCLNKHHKEKSNMKWRRLIHLAIMFHVVYLMSFPNSTNSEAFWFKSSIGVAQGKQVGYWWTTRNKTQASRESLTLFRKVYWYLFWHSLPIWSYIYIYIYIIAKILQDIPEISQLCGYINHTWSTWDADFSREPDLGRQSTRPSRPCLS